ncbi:MAG: hypothetical protein ABL903_20125, partial [Methylococcales bacterium]
MVALPGDKQAVLSNPASAVEGVAAKFTTTSSCELLGQGVPVAIVQRKVYTPFTETVALEFGALALPKFTVPGPVTSVQVPVPTAAVLAAKLLMVNPHTAVSFPANATVGNGLITTS